MKNKDLIMFGIIVGVAFFFLGAMITSSFPGNEENLLPYKISSFVKLIGLGILTTTFLIGGITGHDLNKYFRLSILIIGLVLLLIFTIAAQFMKWDISTVESNSLFGSSYQPASSSNNAYDSRPATPGFELVFAVIAIIIGIIFKKVKFRS